LSLSKERVAVSSSLRKGLTGLTTEELAEDHIYTCGVSSSSLGKQKQGREEKGVDRRTEHRDNERQRFVIRSAWFNAKRGYLNVTCAIHPHVILFTTFRTLRPPFLREL